MENKATVINLIMW